MADNRQRQLCPPLHQWIIINLKHQGHTNLSVAFSLRLVNDLDCLSVPCCQSSIASANDISGNIYSSDSAHGWTHQPVLITHRVVLFLCGVVARDTYSIYCFIVIKGKATWLNITTLWWYLSVNLLDVLRGLESFFVLQYNIDPFPSNPSKLWHVSTCLQ